MLLLLSCTALYTPWANKLPDRKGTAEMCIIIISVTRLIFKFIHTSKQLQHPYFAVFTRKGVQSSPF